MQKKLRDLCTARSGDKGSHANIGVIAKDSEAYKYLREKLTEEMVKSYFKALRPTKVVRYELPNLQAFNFVLYGVLGEGGSRSLRIDAQGKLLAAALLELKL